jgi:hypothetical protein
LVVIPQQILPSDGLATIEPIINKAVAGKSLTEDEQKDLARWLEQRKKMEKSWEQQANRPGPSWQTTG